jgi:hypothetical protein
MWERGALYARVLCTEHIGRGGGNEVVHFGDIEKQERRWRKVTKNGEKAESGWYWDLSSGGKENGGKRVGGRAFLDVLKETPARPLHIGGVNNQNPSRADKSSAGTSDIERRCQILELYPVVN